MQKWIQWTGLTSRWPWFRAVRLAVLRWLSPSRGSSQTTFKSDSCRNPCTKRTDELTHCSSFSRRNGKRITSILLCSLVLGCSATGQIVEEVDERVIKATAQRQDVADRLLRYHVTHVCMANYDSLKRILDRERLVAVRALCASSDTNLGVLIPDVYTQE